MNRALLFLYLTLLKRRALRFGSDLRRPINFISVLIVGGLLGILFYYRNDKEFVQFVKDIPLAFVLSLMFIMAVGRGFLQRGLAWDEGDSDFLFPGPFRPYHLIVYRLLPAYLYAALTAAFLYALLRQHLPYPLTTITCIALFQIISFHASTAASLFAASLTQVSFARCRRLLWAVIVLYAAVLLYSFSPPTDGPPRHGQALWLALSSPWAELFFYPAVDLLDISLSPTVRHQAFRAIRPWLLYSSGALQVGWCLLALVGVLAAILRVLSGIRGETLEGAILLPLNQTLDEKGAAAPGLAVQQQERYSPSSARFPRIKAFLGFASIIWKNLVCARRCKFQLLVAFGYSVLFTVPWICLLMIVGKHPDLEDSFATGAAIPLTIGFLPLLLQTTLPFDLRLESGRIMELRTLPISGFWIVLAILTVPVLFCLSFQALSILSMSFFGQFRAVTLASILLGYPAIAAGVAAVWNFHSLLFMSWKRAHTGATRAEGAVLAIAFAAAIFFPAGFVLHKLSATPTLATLLAITIQYVIDACLILLLARLFDRFEGTQPS